jgi:low temperature requirement protein LtrA
MKTHFNFNQKLNHKRQNNCQAQMVLGSAILFFIGFLCL